MRAKVSHIVRVEKREGEEMALVALASREHKVVVREEGCEVWVALQALPKQLRAIARYRLAVRGGGGPADLGLHGGVRRRAAHALGKQSKLMRPADQA